MGTSKGVAIDDIDMKIRVMDRLPNRMGFQVRVDSLIDDEIGIFE